MAGGQPCQGWGLDSAARLAAAAALTEGAAGGAAARGGTAPGMVVRRAARAAEARHRGEQAGGVGAVAARTGSGASTIRPAYMTATRSHSSATTPRSWVIRRIAMPSSARRPASRSRICAWTVTSSAVVGSSAIRRRGLQASAMAIIARCRRPPDSSNGYWASRRSAAPTPTRRSSSIARSRRAAGGRSVCRRRLSSIWKPTVQTGLSEVIGSWKIMAAVLPRTSRIARSDRLSSSRPASRSRRARTTAGGSGRSRITARAVRLLPQPDSPTRPKVPPAARRGRRPRRRA